MAYLAQSLVKLRKETNTKWPKRDKRTDGWLGDAAHRRRKSEHNPDGKGCVHATDTDKDGIDVKAFLREVIGDSRVWYVIHNGIIWSRTYGWKARKFNGVDHKGWIHVSILLNEKAEKDARPWFTPIHKPGTRRLKRGSTGADVKFVQRKLKIDIDGVFGRNTEAAVKAFQKKNGLEQVGEVGPKTWALMGVKTAN